MTAQDLLLVVEYWLYAGAVVAAAFLLFGIDRIDEDARGAYVFRPLLVPGVLLIWPLVLWRWFVLETGRDDGRARHLPDRAMHGKVWRVLAVLLPIMVIGALALKQSPPSDVAPVKLEASQ